MPAEEGLGGLQDADLGVAVAETVALIREQVHLHRDGVGLEGEGHPLGLLRRHHPIAAACSNSDARME